jgi:hypothetical protein
VAEPSDRYPSCHCSVIVELDNRDVLVGYYAGSGEARPDAAWVLARRKPGEQTFGPLSVVSDTDGIPEGNGVLYQNEEGILFCIYGIMHGDLEGKAGPGVRWRTCDLRMKQSDDRGETWSDVKMIDSEWGNVPRCKPIGSKPGRCCLVWNTTMGIRGSGAAMTTACPGTWAGGSKVRKTSIRL